MPEKEETALEVRPTDLLSAIITAVNNPAIATHIDAMERLLAMHERVSEQQRKTAFMEAMARLQAKLPQINKEGRIIVKGVERSRFVRLEDLDTAVRPLLAEEGFSFSFDSDSSDGKLFKLSCKLSHREGHSETKYLTLPIDTSDYRSNVQSIGSTVSYGKRQLIKMHLNIIEKQEDDDGRGGSKLITEEQVKDLEALIQEVGANKSRFLAYMECDALASILARDFKKAVTALESKRNQK